MMDPAHIERVLDILRDGATTNSLGCYHDSTAREFHVTLTGVEDPILVLTQEFAVGLLTRNRPDAVAIARYEIGRAVDRHTESRNADDRQAGVHRVSHFKNVCKCGAVVSQCRCPSRDKVTKVVCDSCTTCAPDGVKPQDTEPEGANEPLASQIDRLGAFLMEHYPREIGRGWPDGTDAGQGGAIDNVIRLLTPGGANPAPREPESDVDWSDKIQFRETAIRLTVPATIAIQGDAIGQIAAAIGHHVAQDIKA